MAAMWFNGQRPRHKQTFLWSLSSFILTWLNAVPLRGIGRRALGYLPSRYMRFWRKQTITITLPASEIAGEIIMKDGRWWVSPGDWESRAKPLTRTRTYRIMSSLAQRPDLDYHQDPVYLELRDRIESGQATKVNNGGVLETVDDLDAYYVTRCELVRSICRAGVLLTDDPLRFAVGENGAIYKTGDGRHRLAVALALDLEVTGVVRHAHPRWLDQHWPADCRSARKALAAVKKNVASE